MTFCLNTCVEDMHKNCTAVFAQNESRLLASYHLHIEYCVSCFNAYKFNARVSKKIEEKIIPSCYNCHFKPQNRRTLPLYEDFDLQ